MVHHYGSKQGLREGLVAHVAGLFDAMLASVAKDPTLLAGRGDRVAAGFSELMLAHLPPDSPVPAYLRRLLLSGDGLWARPPTSPKP